MGERRNADQCQSDIGTEIFRPSTARIATVGIPAVNRCAYSMLNKTHGGKRKGAGRKPDGLAREQILVAATRENMREIKKLSPQERGRRIVAEILPEPRAMKGGKRK